MSRLEALLNTVDHHRFGEHAAKPEVQRDRLSDTDAVREWLVDHDLLDWPRRVAAGDVAALRAFRDGLRGYLESRDGGARISTAWPPEALRLRAQRNPDTDELELLAAGVGPPGAVERLLADAVIAQARGTLHRLKVCAANDCRFAYYDHSRSRSSRWCSMQTCGNRIKTRNYRQRRR